MMGHKICFYGEICIIISKLSLLPFLYGALCSINFSLALLAEILHDIIINQALDKREYLMLIFLISHSNHML